MSASNPARRLDARVPFLLVNVIGGISVLGSYAWGIATHPETAGGLWGSIPPSVVPLYTGCMPFAAVGYLTVFAFLLVQPPAQVRTARGPAFRWFLGSHAVFLLASTLWMPLCFMALDGPDPGLLPWIQAVLAVAGAAALAHVVWLTRLVDTKWPRLRWAAVIGATCLMVQCTILDALIWPRFFTVGG
jgi:hypothetical protein